MEGSNFMNSVQVTQPNGNVFDLSHDVKFTLDMGVLTPFMCIDTLPGDKYTIGAEVFCRFNALMAPVMHKFDVFTHYFYLPNRILWNGWQDFIKSINDSANAPAAPYLTDVPCSQNSLANYLGLPIVSGTIDKVSAIPFAAYQRIYNEYYRANYIQNEVPDDLIDGSNNATSANLRAMRRRAWNMDYFTAQLPTAQKGAPVTIPLGGSADIKLKPGLLSTEYPLLRSVAGNIAPDPSTVTAKGSGTTSPFAQIGTNGTGTPTLRFDPNNTLFADLTTATAITINQLRTAFAIQGAAELAARVGNRYTEIIKGFWGVDVPDATLQRPLYLGGSKQPMVISEVLQTSETTASSPQGDMAGHGVSVGGGKAFSYRCTEHGYIIGLMSIMPKTAYQQGIEPHWSKFDPLTLGWPQYANLGEQPVKNREVYYSTSDGLNDGTFGYMPMYSEYRTKQSRVAGLMATSLAYWHDGRIFASRPALNSSFIECVPDKRIFTVQTDEGSQVLSHVFNHVRAFRLLPKFGTPSLIS